MAYECLLEQISLEYERHAYVLDSDMILQEDKAKYTAIMNRTAEPSAYATALAFLSAC